MWTTEFIFKLIDRPRNNHDVDKNRPLTIFRLAYGYFFYFGWNREQLYYDKSIVLTIILPILWGIWLIYYNSYSMRVMLHI